MADYYQNDSRKLAWYTSDFDSLENRDLPTSRSDAVPTIELLQQQKRTCFTAPRIIFLALVLIVAGAAVALTVSEQSMSFYKSDVSSNFAKSSSDNFVISINVSSPDYPKLDSLSHLPWQYIIEPYRDQILELTVFSINGVDRTDQLSGADAAYDVIWEIDGVSYSGSKVTANVKSVGIFNTTVILYDGHADKTYSQQFTLAVKYVRREIRSLTETDREKFITTLRSLYDIDLDEGKETYGDKFGNAEYFLSKHLNGAGKTDCDHWHDGAGITTHHVAFTLEAEQALQSIDPSIAMPYWEYAMDAYMYDNWFDSDIFSEDFMGQATPTSKCHSVDNGLWNHVEMPSGEDYYDWSIADSGSLNPFVNAYGILRSPWNNNPSSGIGRYNVTYSQYPSTTSMPDCDLMNACYRSGTYASMADCLNGVTHGPVHILIGGTWGEDDDEFDQDTKFLQGIDKLLFFKMLWRSGFTRCPTECTKDQSTPCRCSIPDEYYEEYGAKGMLEASGVWDIIADENHASDDSTDDYLIKILKVMEDPDVAGEMFSSAAPYDPTFWPVHGQIERILSLKRIKKSQGLISSKAFDETWDYTTANHRYLMGVCDWSGVASIDDLTLPSCNMSSDAICEGHHETDVLEFNNFLGTGDTYTNAEFYEFIHPWNEELPYIYDTYGFDYCTDEGYTF